MLGRSWHGEIVQVIHNIPASGSNPPRPDELGFYVEAQAICEDALHQLVSLGFSRTRVPTHEKRFKTVELNTILIAPRMLRKILRHRNLKDRTDVAFMLGSQLELALHIMHCEKKIREVSREDPRFSDIYGWKHRREMLKFTGSTIAWLLTGFDRNYIQMMSDATDSYIFGQRGTIGELIGLIDSFQRGFPAVMHGVTNCLRISDLTRVGRKKTFAVEIKSKSSKRMGVGADSRESRQRKKLLNLQEFFEKGEGEGVLSQYPSHRISRVVVETTETHHWRSLVKAATIAAQRGGKIMFPEAAFSLIAATNEQNHSHAMEEITKRWPPKTTIWIGALSRQVEEFPGTIPFTLFSIPEWLKVDILLNRLLVTSFVNFDILAKSLGNMGYQLKSKNGVLELEKDGNNFDASGIMIRVVYEFLSIRSLLSFLKAVPDYMNDTKAGYESMPFGAMVGYVNLGN